MGRQDENGLNETWHALQFKVDRCYSLWNNIETAWQEQSEANFTVQRIEDLQNRLLETCERFTTLIAERQQQEQQQDEDLIHRVFFARTLRQQPSSMDLERGSSSSSSLGSSVSKASADSVDPQQPDHTSKTTFSTTDHHAPAARREASKSPQDTASVAVTPNVEDLQKMQREQMEEAISQMTTQLKEETRRIHQTLHVQTQGLGKMEDVATENVDKVTKVTKDVEEHVQSSWTRNVGTWTFFFTMMGVFVFMLVMIQMAPKGKGCVFFCPEQPRPDEFCRTLPNGRMECVSIDEERREKSSKPKTKDKHRLEEESCEIDMYGECLRTQEKDSKVKREKEVDSSVVDDAMFAGGMVQDNVYTKGKPPKFNRKHFTPRDIRNAANLGDYYRLEGYLAVKPEWADKVDKNGWNALHLSARRGDLRAINLLKQVGVDFSIKTLDGRTALDIAFLIYEEGHPVVEALRV